MRAGIFRMLVLPLALIGCASAPPSEPPISPEPDDALADRAAAHAVKMVGTAYRYGGAAPSVGFDCSGLVHYSFRQAGVPLPRNTEEQRLSSRPVALADLRPGDLVFFDHEGEKNSHVGIYTGAGMFVHAPSTGKQVRRDRLDSPYWRKHISETRRPGASIIPLSIPSRE